MRKKHILLEGVWGFRVPTPIDLFLYYFFHAEKKTHKTPNFFKVLHDESKKKQF